MLVDVYTDGSFRKEEIRWGFVIVLDNKELHRGSGSMPKSYNCYRQVAGELMAVGRAIEWAKLNDYKINLFYDYIGVYNWVADIKNDKKNLWQAKKDLTKRYRKFMLENARVVESFTWVKGHSGNKWNEVVDQLMWE